MNNACFSRVFLHKSDRIDGEEKGSKGCKHFRSRAKFERLNASKTKAEIHARNLFPIVDTLTSITAYRRKLYALLPYVCVCGMCM